MTTHFVTTELSDRNGCMLTYKEFMYQRGNFAVWIVHMKVSINLPFFDTVEMFMVVKKRKSEENVV